MDPRPEAKPEPNADAERPNVGAEKSEGDPVAVNPGPDPTAPKSEPARLATGLARIGGRIPLGGIVDWLRRLGDSPSVELGFFLAALGLTIAWLLVPIWSVRVFPSTDLFAHMAVIGVMRGLADPSSWHSQIFEWGAQSPNSLFYVGGYLLSFVSSIETATKLMQSLYVALWPLSAWAFLRAYGREKWLALPACALIYNPNFLHGFIDYSLSIPVSLFGLAAVQRYCDRPTWRSYALAAVLSLLVYFGHLQMYVIYCVSAVIVLLVNPWPTNDWARRPIGWLAHLGARAATILPSFLLFLSWFFRTMWGGSGGAKWVDARKLTMVFHPYDIRFLNLYQQSVDILRSDEDGKMLFATLAVVGLWFCFRRGVPAVVRRAQALPALLALTSLAIYFFAPQHLSHQEMVYHRVAVVALVLALLAIRGTLYRSLWARLALFAVPLLIVQMTYAGVLRKKVETFETRYRGLVELVSLAKRGTRLANIGPVSDYVSKEFRWIRLWHLNQYHYVLNGGTTQDSFAATNIRIVRAKVGKFARFSSGRYWCHPGFLNRVDYVLTSTAFGTCGRTELVGSRGAWRLFRVKR